jgi:lipopolysaccharide transport system ATP-binding protein
VHQSLDNVIFGFYLKDRLGQRLFGDNSFMTYSKEPVAGLPGERLTAVFRFRLPIMPVGTYSIDLAIASGSQDNHTQQHWLHDALEMRAADTSMKHGLVGLPMLEISIRKDADD